MLTGIEIENFKGISDSVRLDVKPLTLIFGANSAGKSTFLHALQYARAVLLHHNVDPARTTSGGESVDLGGFSSFVHGRDLTRAIRLRFHLSLRGDPLPRIINMDVETDTQPPLGYAPKGFADRVDQEAENCWVELHIAWDQIRGTPYISEYSSAFDGKLIGKIVYDPARQSAAIKNINFRHPLFSWLLPAERHLGIVESVEKEFAQCPQEQIAQEIEFRLRRDFSPAFSLEQLVGAQEIKGLLVNKYKAQDILGSRYFERHYESTLVYWYVATLPDDAAVDIDSVAIEVPDVSDALPTGKSLLLPHHSMTPKQHSQFPGFVVPKEFPLSTEEEYCFNAILSHVLASPVELLRRALDGLVHLGPLRQIPARGFVPNRSIDSAAYSTGLAAWDSLAFAPEAMFASVNDWMSNPNKLATGFRIVREQTKVLPAKLTRPNDIAVEYFKAIPRTRVILADANTGLEVEPSEIGVGVSQLLPAVVFGLSDAAKILLIEQPELHLHPRAQCEVGDLLIQSALGRFPKTVIVETHSEHLILRILRRIRETAKGLKSERPPIKPSDLAVWYVERAKGASNPIRIGVDEHGEFTVDWPDDFFESDFYERFA